MDGPILWNNFKGVLLAPQFEIEWTDSKDRLPQDHNFMNNFPYFDTVTLRVINWLDGEDKGWN